VRSKDKLGDIPFLSKQERAELVIINRTKFTDSTVPHEKKKKKKKEKNQKKN